jgi:hypothetical protein
MDKSRDFKIPISRKSSVIATVEIDPGTKVEKIVIHPLKKFDTTDYVTVNITCGKTTVYSGELVSSGMVITPEVPFFPKEDLTIAIDCLSLWESIMGGLTAATEKSEIMYCQFSIITTTNDTIHVDVSKLSDSFADGLLDDWA